MKNYNKCYQGVNVDKLQVAIACKHVWLSLDRKKIIEEKKQKCSYFWFLAKKIYARCLLYTLKQKDEVFSLANLTDTK